MSDRAELTGGFSAPGQFTDEMVREVLRSQQQWQATIDAVQDLIFVIDRMGLVRRTNTAFAAFTGLHPRDVIGRAIESLLPFEIPRPRCSSQEAPLPQGPEQFEIGHEGRTFLVGCFPGRFETDEVCVYVLRDITELIGLKNSLYQSYKIASLGRLVSGVAHEINNPLTGILGFAELLSMKATDETTRVQLEKICKSALRCKQIIESLLCFSRQQPPQKNLENLNELLDRTLDLRAYWIRKNRISVDRQYGEISMALMDSQQIQQVALNLIMNAEQAVENCGRPARIVLRSGMNHEEGRVWFSVEDNGIGIPAETLPRIFDPFFTTKPVNEGTGLGLSISYGIVAEHGGEISVDSRLGEGTTFTVELPVR